MLIFSMAGSIAERQLLQQVDLSIMSISRAQGGLDFTLAGWKTAKLALALCKDHLFYNHISELTFELNGTTEKMPSKD